MSKVAVQLLSWNGAKHLPVVLASLAAQTFADFELLVLDNASTDGSAGLVKDALKTFPRPARFLQSETNLGFAGGHNRLFAMNAAPYVFCVNQDTSMDKDYLAVLVAFLEATPGAAAVAGALHHDDGSMDTAGLKKNWYEKVSDIKIPPRGAATPVFGVSGALPVYRRAAALAVSPDGKLFDENFFAYKEDVDLAWRLGTFGWRAYVVAAAEAVHERGFGEDKKWNPAYFRKQRLSSRNHLLVLVKNLPPADYWRVPAIVFYELGKIAYLAVFVPRALGFLPEFFRLLPQTLKMRKVLRNKLKPVKSHV